MSSSGRYPLEPVVRYRRSRVDVRACELACESERARAAAAYRASCECEAEQHRQATEEAADQAAGYVDRGQARVEDLQRLHSWRSIRAQQQQNLQQQSEAALERERSASLREAQARDSLARAESDAKMMESHRDAHLARVRKRHEEQQEQEASDARASRRGRGKE